MEIDADQEVTEGGVSKDAGIGEESLESHGLIFGSGVFGVAKASLEVGAADFGFVIADRHGIGLEVADEINLLAGAGDAGIDEVALEHHEVLFEQGDNHGGVFAALTFMDADGIGELDFAEFALGVFDVLAVKINGESGFVGGDARYDAGVAIEDVFIVVIPVLDDFIADAVGDAAVFEGRG